MGIIAFKGFESDLTCRGFQYEIGKTYSLPECESPELCRRGFHASIRLPEAFNYYPPTKRKADRISIRSNLRYCEVELDGFCPLSFWEVKSGFVRPILHWDKLCAAQITVKREISEKDIEDAIRIRTINLSYFLKTRMSYDALVAHHALAFCNEFFKKDKNLWYVCDESDKGAVTFAEFWQEMNVKGAMLYELAI